MEEKRWATSLNTSFLIRHGIYCWLHTHLWIRFSEFSFFHSFSSSQCSTLNSIGFVVLILSHASVWCLDWTLLKGHLVKLKSLIFWPVLMNRNGAKRGVITHTDFSQCILILEEWALISWSFIFQLDLTKRFDLMFFLAINICIVFSLWLFSYDHWMCYCWLQRLSERELVCTEVERK